MNRLESLSHVQRLKKLGDQMEQRKQTCRRQGPKEGSEGDGGTEKEGSSDPGDAESSSN